MRSAALLCALQLVNYTLLVMNFRFIAKGRIGLAVVSDGVIAAFSYFALKTIAAHDGPWDQVGYTLGGIMGSYVGMLLTKGLASHDHEKV